MFYEYNVTYWNDYEEKDMKERGLVWANSYSEAADKVYQDFKKDLIDMYLQEWDSYNSISLDEIKAGFHL